MPHYYDLTPYTYAASDAPLRNVGWLGRWSQYPKAPVDHELIDRLWVYRDHGTARTRGYQPCPICCRWRLPIVAYKPVVAARHGVAFELGSSELRVFGSGSGFAAPDLLIHYVLRHQYRPPIQFAEAVREGPIPGTRDYLERFHATAGSRPTGRDVSRDLALISRKDLFRVSPSILDGADFFEDEPTALEVEEAAYFTARSQSKVIVHVNVTSDRVVVQAGRVMLAAARMTDACVLISVGGPDREKWVNENAVLPEEVEIPADFDAGWVRESHVLRFANRPNRKQQEDLEALVLRYFSRNYMLALDGESSLLETPHFDTTHHRLEFVADTPHHDDIWMTWWRNALNILARTEPRLIFYQGSST